MEVAYNPGVIPVNHRVVVFSVPIKEKVGEIYMPESVLKDESLRQIKAIIVFIGPGCEMKCFDSDKVLINIEVGDLVYISKFAGYLFKGADGLDYRLINDDDVAAKIIEVL